jgi:hypothetical protein
MMVNATEGDEAKRDYTRRATCDNRPVSSHRATAAIDRLNPYLLLTLTPFFWSCNWIVGRGLASDIPPMAMTFLRWFFAVLILAPFALAHVRRDWPILRRNWKILLFSVSSASARTTRWPYAGLTTRRPPMASS